MVVQIVEALDMCVGGVLSPMPDPTTALVIAITSPRFHHSPYNLCRILTVDIDLVDKIVTLCLAEINHGP